MEGKVIIYKRHTAAELLADAKKYPTREQWTINSPEAYDEALLLHDIKVFKACLAHMPDRNGRRMTGE